MEGAAYDSTPFLTSEEMLMLQELDPKFRTHLQKELDQQSMIATKDYRRNVRLGVEELTGDLPSTSKLPSPARGERAIRSVMPDEEDEVRAAAGSPEGGFAWASLIPFVAPLIPTVINGIVSLFKKKPKAEPVNGMPEYLYRQQTSGLGVRPPNVWGSGKFGEMLAAEFPRLMELEQEIRKMRGKQFWAALIKTSQKEVKHMLQANGVSPKGAGVLSKAALRRVIPASFQQFVMSHLSKGKKAIGKAGKTAESQIRSIIRPIGEWLIHKATQGKLNPSSVRHLVDIELEKIDSKYPVDGSGKKMKDFWAKVKKIARTVGLAVLPKVADVAKEKLPDIIDFLLNKFVVKGNGKLFKGIPVPYPGMPDPRVYPNPERCRPGLGYLPPHKRKIPKYIPAPMVTKTTTGKGMKRATYSKAGVKKPFHLQVY